jgi:hypothetical protein
MLCISSSENKKVFTLNYNMKNCKLILLPAVFILLGLSFTSCSKVNSNSDSLYVPSNSDVTSTASLKDLQDGRVLYVNNCGDCHSYYMPESYSSGQWTSILASMAPRTSLTSQQVQLVKKYVTKGK